MLANANAKAMINNDNTSSGRRERSQGRKLVPCHLHRFWLKVLWQYGSNERGLMIKVSCPVCIHILLSIDEYFHESQPAARLGEVVFANKVS